MTAANTTQQYDERSYPPAFLDCQGKKAVLVQNIYRKSVVFIGRGTDEDFIPLGTGFIVSVVRAGYRFFYLTTARHVVGGISAGRNGLTEKISIRLNKEGGGTECLEFSHADWKIHPQDHIEASDTMVLPAAWLDRKKYVFAHIPLDDVALTDARREELSVGVGDEVFAVGLFTKHQGKSKNVPVVRIGNIALMPEEQVKTKVGYISAYLVEAHSIGGLSGSPVFIHFSPFRKAGGKIMPLSVEGALLLGLMHGHFDIDEVDSVVEDRSDGGKLGIHTGMGVVIPVTRLLELIESLDRDRQTVIDGLNAHSSVAMDSDNSASS